MRKGISLMNNKKGLEMAFNTIVVIILSLILLVTLIVIFNKSSTNFTEKISLFLGSSNVDSVRDSCNVFVTNNAQYQYCCTNQTITLSKKEKYQMTCAKASEETFGDSINKLECTGVC